jgi:GT2 family glycosyltransferase
LTEKKFDLSLCIATWNACDLTMACLKSILGQTRGITYEIILVDNGSIDDTVEKVRKNFPQVKLILNSENKGFTYASNQALQKAVGRYSILLNNDTLLNMDALSKMVAFMDDNIDIGVLGCRLRLTCGTVQKTAYEDVSFWDYLFSAFYLHRIMPHSRIFGRSKSSYLDYEANNLVIDTGWVVGAALMVRTALINKIGLLDEKIVTFGEDWEWCRRFAAKGYRVVYYSGAEIIHYLGASSINYMGKDRDRIRKRSIMHATAGTHYVYRKLHKDGYCKIALFSLAFRIHCFSRVIALGLLNIIQPDRADYGSFRGYLESVFISYKSICKKYLRFEST